MDDYPPEAPRDDQTVVLREQIPTPMVSDEIWKLLLDRSRIPDTLVHMMKGDVWIVYERDGEIKGRWEQKGLPLMNERGIRFFTPLFYSSVTPDKLATFLTEDEVNRMVMNMMENVVDIISERGEEFEIPASNRSYVVKLIEDAYFIGLTASRKGTILQALKPMYERKEVVSPQREKQGTSIVPSFLRGD